jgi:Zn-finger nucleic acid-binding protein
MVCPLCGSNHIRIESRTKKADIIECMDCRGRWWEGEEGVMESLFDE